MSRNAASPWNPNKATQMNLKTREIIVKQQSERGCVRPRSLGDPGTTTRPSPRMLFLTGFTNDILRFEVHFSFVVLVLRTDSTSENLWYEFNLTYLLPIRVFCSRVFFPAFVPVFRVFVRFKRRLHIFVADFPSETQCIKQ